jgi:hypothetical protein
VPKIQFIRFLNLDENPEVKAPGDSRLWKALAQVMPALGFLSFKALCVEWPDSVEDSEIPKLEDWAQIFSQSGLSSVSISQESEAPSIQRRFLGRNSSDLEILTSEYLVNAGYKAPQEIWEVTHFEIVSQVDVDVLEENILKLFSLESRSGLLDTLTEDIRFLRSGESWSWPRSGQLDKAADDLSLAELLKRWKEIEESQDLYDPLRRAYVIREQRARGVPSNRDGKALRERLAELEETRVESLDDLSMWGVAPAFIRSAKHVDQEQTAQEIFHEIAKNIALGESSVNPQFWLEAPSHRSSVAISRSQRRTYTKRAKTGVSQLYALAPLNSGTALKWRRLEFMLSTHKDIFETPPVFLSGSAPWLASLRNLISLNRGWELGETALRKVFAWEAQRVPAESLCFFYSHWSPERIRQACGDFLIEAVFLGSAREDVDHLIIKTENTGDQTVSWVDILAEGDLLGANKTDSTLSWTSPDLKTPTYGFEKVSIFPDQYLLRVMNYGSRGVLQRKLQERFKGHSQVRETQMRHPWSLPIQGVRWGKGEKLFADALASGGEAGSVDPKRASGFAIERCLRELVARGVNPDSAIMMNAYLNKPHFLNHTEKDSVQFGSYTLAAEGIIESLESLKNIHLGVVDFELNSSPVRDYEPEPCVQMRGEISDSIHSALSGFRMNGEVLYAVGVRPAFMDVGSRILQHVRVVSNHVTYLNWNSQLELYRLIYQCLQEHMITDIRPIGYGGLAETILEMAMWSGIGIQLKPSLSTIELFSASPGRFLVGILPQEAKKFETMIKSEWLTHVGTTGGEKLFGLSIERYREERGSKT